MTPPEQAVLDASAILEALRPQSAIAIGGKPEDEPIVRAWEVALERFRVACDAYEKAARGGP